MVFADTTHNQLLGRISGWSTRRNHQRIGNATSSVGFSVNSLNSLLQVMFADICSSLRPDNITAVLERGQSLWNSIYRPFEVKLVEKLALSHPDLPIHILESEYGNLFSDPQKPPNGAVSAKVGRVLTSIVAVACLRAQTGVGPQVVSHIFGLRKAYEDGTYKAEGEEEIQGGEWLASNEGSIWLLEMVDRIVEAIGGGRGTSFAPGLGAKL